VSRAAWGSLLFYRDEDYSAYLRLLRQLVRDRLVIVYAFCMLPDEIRLIVRPMRLGLGRVIQRLHGSHTLRINTRLQRHGSLFRGRYESTPFAEGDLCSAVRSVHLLPVRSGYTRHAETFTYSSHSTYLGQGDAQHDFVQVHPVLEAFKGSSQFPQKSFAKYVEAAALDSDESGITQIVNETSNELVASKPWRGRKSFLASLAERISLLLSVNLVNLRGPSRRQDLVMARRLMATIAVLAAEQSVTEVAKFLRRDKSQISRLVSQGMDLVEADEPFRVLYDSVWHERKRIFES
jgi:putative transposase